jgi:hypothetical protein
MIGTSYVGIARSQVGSGTAFPTSPALGQLFFRSDLNELRYWNGSTWVLIPSSLTKTLRVFAGNNSLVYEVTIGTGGPPLSGNEGDVHYQYDGTGGPPPPPTVSNLNGDVDGPPGANTVRRLQGRNVLNVAPQDGDVLTWNASLLQWQPSPRIARPPLRTVLRKTIQQTIPANNWQSSADSPGVGGNILTFDTPDFDDLGLWGTNTQNFVFPRNVRVKITLKLVVNFTYTNSPHYLYVYPRKNGSRMLNNSTLTITPFDNIPNTFFIVFPPMIFVTSDILNFSVADTFGGPGTPNIQVGGTNHLEMYVDISEV